MTTALAGVGVLVTRPAAQAAGLAQRITDAGGRAVCFAPIEILDPVDNKPLLSVIERLESFDLAIFISPNAVTRAVNIIHGRRGRLPAHLTLACIGRQSARELAHFGYHEVLSPSGRFDSEGLLALPPLAAVAGRRVVVFRGDGGRELLGDTLTARGAHVEYAECYRRERPDREVGPLLRAWARKEIDVATYTSGETLRALFDLLGKLGQQWLIRTPAVVLSERIGEVARELGCKATLVIAPSASDEGLVEGLLTWRTGQKAL